MDFTLTEFEGELLDLGRTYAEREIAPVAARAWHEERCPTELLRGLGELGLLGPLVPEKWGGIGSTTVGYVALLEALATVDPSVATAWQAHSTIGSLPLLLFGDDEQRERWLRPLAEGRQLGAFGLTEPGAGSDVRSLRTRAERVSGGWVLNGQKAFITNAGTDMSFGVTVLARTGEDASGKPRFGSFIVEQGTEGYTLGPKLRGIGWKSADTRDLFFDDVFVPDSQVVGEPGGGLGQFLSALEVGRISVAALVPRHRRGRDAAGPGLRQAARGVRHSRSPASRRSSSSWRTWRPRSRPPAGSPTTPPRCATRASRSRRRPPWPS